MLLATADDSMITTYTTNIDTTLSVGIVVVSISISDDVQGVGVCLLSMCMVVYKVTDTVAGTVVV